MDLFRNSIRFHGSTYQFTTEYKSISRFFMLPMQDEVHMAFVIALDKPLKQGQTTYNYMVMQFKKETEGDVKLKV
jgi:structure-specific recognition protein 1